MLLAHPIVEDQNLQKYLNQIVEGISRHFSLDELIIDGYTRAESVHQRARSKPYEGMILLGAEGLQLAQQLEPSSMPIVTGYNYVSPNAYPNVSGVCLHTTLDRLLAFTRKVLPGRVRLIYIEHPDETFFIEHAKQKARQYGYQIEIYAARSEVNTRRILPVLFNTIRPQDIILLPLSLKSMSPPYYESVLVSAWGWRLPLISHMFRYALQGIMIGSYPDPIAYGEQIAKMLKQRIQNPSTWKPKVELAQHVLISYNDIYGSRLGIQLPSELRQEISKFISQW